MMNAPAQVSALDDKLMRDMLALLSLEPGMPFVSAYKTILAEQTGDNAWLAVRAPLTALTPAQEQTVRREYRKIMA